MKVSLSLAAVTVALTSVSAWGAPVLFSDLGSGSSVYNTASNSWGVEGSNNTFAPGLAQEMAMLFTVGGSGAQAVDQIDLAMWNFGGAQTFTASIWTDVSNHPGSQVANAFWSLSTSNVYNSCCALSTQSGISGVSLTGGAQYFMVLAPVSLTDTSTNGWAYNSTSVSADVQSSADGSTWNDQGSSSNYAAFDVLGGAAAVPEPASFLLCGAGLAGLIALRLRKRSL
jgi:hypothetical protein